MAATGKKTLTLPAGNGYFVEVIRQSDGTGQETDDDSGQYPDPIPEPGGGEFLSGQTNRLYIAQWLVRDSEGNTLESSSRLIDLAFWIEPEALTSWDFLIPTPEELCNCKDDFPFGEEEDDGSYLADEWYFCLYMEGDGDPERDYLEAMGMALKGGVVVGVRYKVIPVPEGARPQVVYKEAPSTCQRGRAHWVLRWSLPNGSSWEMDLLLEAPLFGQDPPPPKAMEYHWLEWWDEIGQSCEATPYVADGLKVTKWLDFAAEIAMGFLPCGGIVVLIKRYWMGQEVGWIEWTDAVLSCIPYLGRLGGLALRGFAGSAKWFLSSRKLRHLAEGKERVEKARRLSRRVAKGLADHEPGSCGVVSQSQWHHIATDKYRRREPKYTEEFERIFKEAGMSLQDPDNLVNLLNHTGPHPRAYHEWVKQNLLDALQGKQTMEEKQRALKERLGKIRKWLLENPDKLNSRKYPGLLR